MSSIFQAFITKSWEEGVLRLAKKLGSAEGAEGRPTKETPKYSVGENEVRSKIRDQLVTLQQKASAEVNKILPEIERKNSDLHDAKLKFESRKAPDDIEATLQGALEGQRNHLTEVFLSRSQTEGHYNKFRLDNGITRDPDHPEDLTHYFSVIYLLLAIETVLNCNFGM